MSSRHPCYANPTEEQQRLFDDAVKRCRDIGVDPFEQVSTGAYVGEDGSTLDVNQLASRWELEMSKETP